MSAAAPVRSEVTARVWQQKKGQSDVTRAETETLLRLLPFAS